LLRVARIARRLFTLQGLRYAALLAVLTALGGGAAFSSVETGASAWDGVSWVVATMTTVGYGDVVPHTTSGRLIGIAVMVVGIGFLSLLIGAVAQRFVETEIREEAAEAEEDVVREVDAVRDEIVRELRSLAQRLRDPERSVEGLGG
jgi:voltage-gated potassium channel